MGIRVEEEFAKKTQYCDIELRDVPRDGAFWDRVREELQFVVPGLAPEWDENEQARFMQKADELAAYVADEEGRYKYLLTLAEGARERSRRALNDAKAREEQAQRVLETFRFADRRFKKR